MTRIASFPPVTFTLAFMAFLSALVLASALLPSWVSLPPARRTPDPMLGSLAFANRDTRPLATYATIVDRPLFNPNRQKDPSAPAPGSKVASALPALASYRLVGLLISKDARLALVERRADQRIVTLHAGDVLDGRHVQDIEASGVAFNGPSGNERLTIPKANGDPWPIRSSSSVLNSKAIIP